MVDRIADSLYIIQMMLSLFWPSLTAHPFPLPSIPPHPTPPHPNPIHTYRTVTTTTTTLTGKERKEWTSGQSSDENPMTWLWLSLRPNISNPTTHHILFCGLHNDEQWQQIRTTLLRKNRADERPKLGRESHDKTMAITPSSHLKPYHLPHPFLRTAQRRTATANTIDTVTK